jgi:hypothetical protein
VLTKRQWSGCKRPSAAEGGIHLHAKGGRGTDPYAKDETADNNWVKTGPHVMIVGAAEDMMQDHPRDSKPDSTKPYVMWPDRCDWPLARAAQRKPPRRIQLLLVMRLFSSRSL